MEAIYHELAAGKDTSLSQVLDAWAKTYEQRYESLKNEFSWLISNVEDSPEVKRPRSADFGRLSLFDFREQFEEVIKLRAALSVEVEALEQLRAELEDSESMSEVHIQLERATLENKRLQSAVRAAHEQVSELYFSKRVLEAEMSALRSERDRQLSEANERVRLAERAVVAAATSRRRFSEPIATKSPVLASRSGAHSGTGVVSEPAALPSRAKDGSTDRITGNTENGPTTVIATGSTISKPAVTSFRHPLMGFKIASQMANDDNRFKNYTTLTTMSFEEFDSLDEDDLDEAESDDDKDTPQSISKSVVSTVPPAELLSEQSVSESAEKSSDAPIQNASSETFPALPTPIINNNEVHCMVDVPGPTEPAPLDSGTDVQTVNPEGSDVSIVTAPTGSKNSALAEGNESPMILSPTTSSTPRKSLPSMDIPPQAQTPLLKDLSTDWHTDIVPADLDTVPKSDYLRLLDELDAVRRELEAARCGRNIAVVATSFSDASVPNQPNTGAATSSEHIGTNEFDPGLTEQLRDLANKVEETSVVQQDTAVNKRNSLLPPSGPGTTRLFDWSISPNQSSSSVEPATVEKLAEYVDAEETPVRSTPSALCTGCLQLKAKLIAGEVVASSEYEEMLRSTTKRLDSAETRVKELESELMGITSSQSCKVPKFNTGVQCGEYPTVECRSVETLTDFVLESDAIQTVKTPCASVGSQIEASERSESNEELALELRRYSKLSADAACICLALAQRLASLNHRGVPDGEQSMESSEDFNQLLSALSGPPKDNEEDSTAMYRSGYKILAPALTQLNQEVERLACALDAESTPKPTPNDLFVSISSIVTSEDNKDAEITELRNRLSIALQLLADQLPAETRKALADTKQLVEAERLQLEAELERRMVLFEQNHTSSLTELETSRRSLVEQLANTEAANVQLRDELAVLTQKFQAKERFLAEQTEEREAEREEFRTELSRLENQLQAMKAQVLSSKLINNSGHSDGKDLTLSPSEPYVQWYADSDDTDHANQPAHEVKRRKRSGGIGYQPVGAAWTSDKELDDEEEDVDVGNMPHKTRSGCRTSPPTVQREVSWVAPSLATLMVNNSNSMLLDDLEPISPGDDLCSAVHPNHFGSHTYSSAIETADRKIQVDQKEVQTVDPRSEQIGLQTDDLLLPIPPHNCDTVQCSDSYTQTETIQDMINTDTAPSSATKTTTTTTRRTIVDGLSAAALLQRIAFTTEECTTCVTSTDPSGDKLFTNKNQAHDVSVLMKLLKTRESELDALRAELTQIIGKDEWKKITTLVKSSYLHAGDELHSESLRRSWSTPSLTTQSIGSTAGDTGVEMSRGMTMIESTESAGVFDEVDSEQSPIPRPYSGPETLHILIPDQEVVPWTNSNDTGTDLKVPSQDENKSHETTVIQCPVIEGVDDVGSWSAVSSLEPTPNPDADLSGKQIVFPVEQRTTSKSIVDVADVDCDTGDLAVEIIPTSELEVLIGQKEASEVVISTMRAEIDSLLKYQNELQTDYNTVQSMLDDRQAEIDRHTREILALQDRCMILDRQVNERKNVILERDEDLFLVTEEKDALQAELAEVKGELEALRNHQLNNCASQTVNLEIQTDVTSFGMASVGTMVNQSILANSLDLFKHPAEITSDEENADTIQDDASSLHSLNVAEADDLLIDVRSEHASIQTPMNCPAWMTSTPHHRSSSKPADRSVSEEVPSPAIPDELKTLVKRLREESLRLFSLASACQPGASMCPNNTNYAPEGELNMDNIQSEVVREIKSDMQSQFRAHTVPPTIRGSTSVPLSVQQPSLLTDLVRANAALKATLKTLSRTVESYENPTTDSNFPICLTKDHVHELVRCTAHALASDELVWLGMLNWSLCHTANRVGHSLRTGVQSTTGTDTKLQQFVWGAIGRLVEQLSIFMRQEDKYRECLVQAHLVEQQCLNSELQTALNRVNNLSHEIDRLTERLASHKEALNQADNLNLRLSNQVNSLKTELNSVTSELEKEKSAVHQNEPRLEELSTRLLEQQQTTSVLRSQLEAVCAEKCTIDKERSELMRTVEELKKSLVIDKKRAEVAEQQLSDVKVNWKDESKATHASAINCSTCIPTSPLHARMDNGTKSRDVRSDNDLFHVISHAATNLAVARHTANKAERRARELQTTNQSLRLSLAEAELRLMPLLVTVTNRDFDSPIIHTTNTSGVVSGANDAIATTTPVQSPARGRDHLTTSSRFAELKGMCTRLLSLASAEDQESQSPDSSDEDDGVQPVMLNSFSPNKTPIHRSNHQDRNHLSQQAERDSRLASIPVTSTTSCSFLASGPKAGHEDQVSSSTKLILSDEQTVSVDRFRNLHTRYLRSESYRRALTFQKRYLLLLLGGFQYSEETVLASISRPDSTIPVDTSPSSDGSPSLCFRLQPLRRFRVAVRAVQVIHRMRRMIHRWRRSGLQYPAARPTCERVHFPARTSGSPRNLTKYDNLPWSVAVEPSRPPLMGMRTPLRELDVGLVGGLRQQQAQQYIPPATIAMQTISTPLSFRYQDVCYTNKPTSYVSQAADLFAVSTPTVTPYSANISSPLSSHRPQTIRSGTSKPTSHPGEWATTSTTNMSQLIVRGGQTPTVVDPSPPIRSTPILCDTHSNHHVQFDRTSTRTRIASASTNRTEPGAGSDRRRPSTAHSASTPRNGIVFSPRFAANSRSSVKKPLPTINRPCRQPPFK